MTMQSYHIFDQCPDEDKDLRYKTFTVIILNGPTFWVYFFSLIYLLNSVTITY